MPGEASTPSSVSDNSTDKNVSESKLSWQEQKEAQARLRKRQNDLKKTEERIGELEDRDGEIDALMVQEEIFTNSVKCQELAKEKSRHSGRIRRIIYEMGGISGRRLIYTLFIHT